MLTDTHRLTMISDFSIDVQVPQQRVCYVESRRSAHVRLENDNDNNWWLWPDTLNWWERKGADVREAIDVIKEPVSDTERAEILRRVMTNLREEHSMWTNIAGQTNDPRPAGWKAPPVRTDIDPELAFLMEGVMDDDAQAYAGHVFSAAEDAVVLEQIDRALAAIGPLADQNWDEAQSIARQLQWCRGKLRGEAVETPPGPFSMGLIATREFDMYGQQPDLAMLINDIQRAMQQRGCP